MYKDLPCCYDATSNAPFTIYIDKIKFNLEIQMHDYLIAPRRNHGYEKVRGNGE